MSDEEKFDLWLQLCIKEFEAEVKYYAATLQAAQMRLKELYNLQENLKRARDGLPPLPLEMPDIQIEE